MDIKTGIFKKALLLLILIGSEVICLLLAICARRFISDDTFILSFKEDSLYFMRDDIMQMEKENICMTYFCQMYPKISNGLLEQNAEVIATNENAAYFLNMNMLNGAFFNKKQEENHLAVAVLNHVAAYQFFGNTDCIGQIIYLDQTAYEVIGVAETMETDQAKIYIPYHIMEVQNMANMNCKYIWYRFENMAEASLVIGKAGYLMEDIVVWQGNLYKDVFMLRVFLPVIIAGFMSIFELIKKGKIEFAVKKKCLKNIIMSVGLCGLIVFAMVIILRIVWRVPPYYELAGKNVADVLYSIFDFYTLAWINIEGFKMLSHWNVWSLFLLLLSFVCLLAIKAEEYKR